MDKYEVGQELMLKERFVPNAMRMARKSWVERVKSKKFKANLDHRWLNSSAGRRLPLSQSIR